MKAKELAEKLLEYPDFAVDIAVIEDDPSSYGTYDHPSDEMTVTTYKIVGISDIGHSDKLIRLAIDKT